MLPPAARGQLISSGSGFFVTASGHVVTNDHVIAACPIQVVRHGGVARAARVIRRDSEIDLALLETDHRATSFATLRENGNPRRGEAAIAVGYPLRSALSHEPIVTVGTVAALAGIGGDRRTFQITTPIQPGNSGGPLLDGSGHVAGVVVARLNDLEALRRTGAIPQNVNFAVRVTELRDFVEDARIGVRLAQSAKRFEADEIGERGAMFVVAVECYR